MKRTACILLCAICIIVFLPLVVVAKSEMAVSATCAALFEPTTGQFLYEKQKERMAPMASTTKIMTAYVALKYGNPRDVVTISPIACGIEGSSLYLKEGERFSLHDLLYGIMLQSANDASVAVAIHIAGSVEAFAALMNHEAQQMGATHTHFTNPHGLDDAMHYTTAEDLAYITAAALDIPLFREIVSTRKHAISAVGDTTKRVLYNHNKLLRLYDGAIGVKTGFTKRCGRCLVGAAEQEGLTLISVTLNAPDDWNDHARMLNFGFDRMESRLLYSAEEYTVEIPSFNQPGRTVICTNPEPISIPILKSAPSPTPLLQLPHWVPTPQKSGTVVGSLSFPQEHAPSIEIPLVIKEIQSEKR